MFKCIPLFRACNRQVEYIDRRHCNLQSVPDDVLRYIRSLEELLLDANQIRDLPRGFFRLVQLRKLSVSDNEIGRLAPDIGHLVNLMEMDLSKNEITEIPDNIKFCENLQDLDFSSNPLNRLPDVLTQLRNLTHLGLNDIALSRLPNDLGNLSSLVSLEIRENNIRTLPASMSRLTKLEILDLGSNEIEELNETIGSLPSLQELWLDCNELSELPSEIGNLKKLQQLDVSENQLDYLPEEIGGIQNLTDLSLSQNNLEQLPDGIGQLKKLSILKIDQNRLLSLNPFIGNCENIQELILTENLLSELPTSIGKLKNMNNFNVDRNRLTEIPVEMGKCCKLGVLSMRDNRLLRLPQELGNLKDLHVLDVSGNRLEYLPMTIANLNLKALWLSENQAQPMLKYQTDFDDRTGQKVLTCFLLPQQAFHTESMENLLRGSIATDQDSRLSWNDREKNPRDSVIRFAGEPESDEEGELGTEYSPFVRHDTPHPKELKARHAKMHTKRTIDGHIIPHQEKKENQAFIPMRDPKWVDNENEMGEGDALLEKKPHIKYKAVENIPVLKAPDHNRKNWENDRGDEEKISEHQPLLREVARATVTVEGPVANHLEDKDESTPKEDKTEEEDENSSEEDSDDEDFRERKVGFAEDVEEQNERKTGLRRRDTPHHKKGKRINQAEDSKEKVLEILAQVAKQNEKPDSSSETEEVEHLNTTQPSGDEMVEVEEDEITITIHREPRQGLGISIAGGKGSSPYKEDDESIFISRVSADGPAGKAGVQMGDKLISVNDVALLTADHYEAVNVLKQSGNDITMVLGRERVLPLSNSRVEEKSPQGFATVSITSDNNMDVYGEKLTTVLNRDEHGLGFSIAGGQGSVPFKGNDNSIYISRIIENGTADKDGKLAVGDRIISINDVDMKDARHDQAVALLTGIDPEIKLVVYREKFVSHEEAIKEPPSGEKLSTPSQPRIVWSQTSSPVTTSPAPPSPSPVLALNLNSSAAPPLNQSPVSATLNPNAAVSFSSHTSPSSPSNINKSSSPSLSPKNLSSEWTQPRTVVQPPRFNYPGFNKSQSRTSSEIKEDSPHLQSSVAPISIEKDNKILLDNRQFSKEEVDAGHRTVVETRDTISVVNHVDSSKSSKFDSDSVEEITIVKAGGPLGLSIVGGCDHSSHPFGTDEPGVFVSKIVPDGAAYKSTLKIGDRILSVNGKDISKATHQDAVMALIAPTYEIKLVVRHDPPPLGMQDLLILKGPGEKLGMSIKGGVKSYSANPLDKSDEGIFISRINDGGAVARDGRLIIGMRILEVNGQSLLGSSHQEAVRALRSVGDKMAITICDGFDPSSLDISSPDTPSSPVGFAASPTHHSSISSIDKEDEYTCIVKQEQELINETEQWEREHQLKMQEVNKEREMTLEEYEKQSMILEQEQAEIRGPESPEQHDKPANAPPPIPPKPAYLDRQANVRGDNAFDPVREARAPSGSFDPVVQSRVPSGSNYFDPVKQSTVPTSSIYFDPVKQARVPSGAYSSKFSTIMASENEELSFRQKRTFFEKEIKQHSEEPTPQAKQFSYLADHEIVRMKQEEDKKMNSMSKEELLSSVTSGTPEQEYDQVLS
ncbi:hypothetical protein ScPMuIL_007896, partial [Solemya velum]